MMSSIQHEFAFVSVGENTAKILEVKVRRGLKFRFVFGRREETVSWSLKTSISGSKLFLT
jgi:hypothetical protein